eukprot:INCI9358.1.p2 GENE.INCI9358.1~~INCI9358.1.p2  ORF type:complete len:477 (+),score=87.39 INCI9358.1:290-1720(+)
MATSIRVGDLVDVQLPNGAFDGPYRVELEASGGTRFKCRRLKDNRLTKKLPVSQLCRHVDNSTGTCSGTKAAHRPVAPAAPGCSREKKVPGNDQASPLTRLAWAELTAPEEGREKLVEALGRDSLFVLTDLGKRFERAYERYLAAAKTFFLHASVAEKKACISHEVYSNERRVPMWFCGYESTDIRECFRVPGGALHGAEFIDQWPAALPKLDPEKRCMQGSPAQQAAEENEHVHLDEARAMFQLQWEKITRMLQNITDKCLQILIGEHARSGSSTYDDVSVAYTFHYHNHARQAKAVGGAAVAFSAADVTSPASNQSDDSGKILDETAERGSDVTLQHEEDLVVTEHCDPSLFVVEPCSEVGGLEVYLRSTDAWSEAEALCVPGKEVIVFCGRALENITKRLAPKRHGASSDDTANCVARERHSRDDCRSQCPWLPAGGIPATPHRVRFCNGPGNEDDHRFCVIFEQKYAEFYPQ